MKMPRPPLDPDLAPAQNSIPKVGGLIPHENLEARRKAAVLSWDAISNGTENISHTEIDIPGPACPLRASILKPTKPAPPEKTIGIVHFHGGGFCTANRFQGLNTLFRIVEELGAVVLSAEYRLTPENPQPAPVEDSYAAFLWAHAHAKELGFNPERFFTIGGSAGGNLTAGVSFLARDRKGPKILGQLLLYPWLDDITTSPSIEQYGDLQPWTKEDNAHGLDFALGKNRENVSIYTLPAKATDLSGLPTTYLDVGEADVFRDQDMDFASALWKAGIQTELHVWPGAWHAFDACAPGVEVSRRAIRARQEWIERVVRDADS